MRAAQRGGDTGLAPDRAEQETGSFTVSFGHRFAGLDYIRPARDPSDTADGYPLGLSELYSEYY